MGNNTVKRCKFCGQVIEGWQELVKADGGCLGKVIYAHKDCCKMHDYNYEHLEHHHKPRPLGFRWGAEFETNTHTTDAQRLQLYTWYKLICTSDCTVSEEYKSAINYNLNGVKDMLDGINKIIDISNGDNIGTHANVSLEKWDDRQCFYNHREFITEVFGRVARYLNNVNRAQITEVFGRDFGEYRCYTDYNFAHGAWLQIKRTCLEFRLAKYVNTNQYFYLLSMLKQWCLILDKSIEKYNVITFDRIAEKTAKKMINAFNDRVKGYAVYMDENRNKKAR